MLDISGCALYFFLPTCKNADMGQMPRIFPKASKMKSLGRRPARRSAAVSYLKLIVRQRDNMQLMLTHHVRSAYSVGLKCTEDNKLQQISTAKELLKPGGSLGYKFNSSLCVMELLHAGQLCQHKRDSTADMIAIMKTEMTAALLFNPFLSLPSSLPASCSSIPHSL